MILLNSCLYFPEDERQNSKEKLAKIKCVPYQHALLRGARYKIWHKAVKNEYCTLLDSAVAAANLKLERRTPSAWLY